jgi:hypothetical protein
MNMNLFHQLMPQSYHLAQLDQETFNLDMEVVWELFISQPKLIRRCGTIFITFFIIWVFFVVNGVVVIIFCNLKMLQCVTYATFL